MRIELLANKLAADGIGVLGQNLFAYFMPALATTGILVLPRLGRPLDPHTPGWRFMDGFQVVVRGPDVVAGQSIAANVTTALATEMDFELPGYEKIPGMHVLNIRAINDPFVYARDEAADWEVSTNYTITYTLAS